MEQLEITVHSDGGCIGNPGVGGWAFIARYQQEEQRRSGSEASTTNNRMELRAVIEALTFCRSLGEGARIRVFTDSQYVQKGISEWVRNWERNGWKTASKDPVKNQELWKELLALNRALTVEWNWVKGHAGHELNEACDSMVREAMNSHGL